ncbi:Uncharacterized protein OS=Singulisphaera acidiphila (strain ATCC BAA-1392 / DSM 18658 / VKM B-2454 / MOB10) GN=Sinac_1679 PE=4 SV=1 [Gemmata massiliana]|uniref:Uncharacterized protein n=1 Tax=Gemmata massiliana TaxID=1210884 RepID=A0A6P2CSZ5_9BACT|nr:hypothetical protein [Gemmata massiliana]VTR91215.1 Uncharacterized protein OS=Singulisphaera acidiphila (strain ATCC BAA-1392 / DSM 18658 / VKM B-2454 / MOB10) GN=Sinac_1679 PE=4 SV=1 [Gemmata massiliana]
MNKRQWFASTDPQPMLHFIRGRASDRKLRLFAVACCRHFWPAFAADDSARRTVELAERFADGGATVKEYRIARALAEVPWGPESDHRLCRTRELAKATVKANASGAALDAGRDAMSFASAAISMQATSFARNETARRTEAARQITSLRCIFGNPFRPFTIDPSWLTTDVLTLAHSSYADRAFDRLPILADALQDAGCDNESALKHLRSEGEHARGCWVLDLVLGKE